jgi:hypothetical protein
LVQNHSCGHFSVAFSRRNNFSRFLSKYQKEFRPLQPQKLNGIIELKNCKSNYYE